MVQSVRKQQIRSIFLVTVILAFLAGAVIVMRMNQLEFLHNTDSVQNSEAVFQAEMKSETAFDYKISMAGTWEYYPGVLLCSGGQAAGIHQADEQEPLPEAELGKELGQEESGIPDPILVRIPTDRLTDEIATLSADGGGSFRCVLKNVPDLGENNLCLYFADLSADYKVFANAQALRRLLPAPNSHQIYSVNETGDVEIVIEITSGLPVIHVAPLFSYVTTPMTVSDYLRNFSALLIAVFLVVFIMFLVFFSSSPDRKMRPVFLYGFILTITYICNVSWALGIDSLLTGIAPMSMVFPVSFTLQMAVTQMAFWLYYREYPLANLKKYLLLESLAVIASWLLILIGNVFLFQRWMILAGILLLLAAVVGWIVTVYRTVITYKENKVALPCVLSLTLAAVMINLLQWDLTVHLNLFYVFPAAIGIYLVFCFYKYSRYKQQQIKKMEELLETEKLASRTQAALLASQIQPHFLNNTLLTIQNLCKKDPNQASELIVRFSNYLRHNIDFMNYTDLIPFTKELEHIDNYIYIQKARFGDKLEYQTDISVTDFEIPPLTIQPLIENAVKYGIRNSLEGGTVLLKVWQDEAFIHILVSNDTGMAFDPDTAKLRSLINIRERLTNLLGAVMEFRKRESAGGSSYAGIDASAGKEYNNGMEIEIIFLKENYSD